MIALEDSIGMSCFSKLPLLTEGMTRVDIIFLTICYSLGYVVLVPIITPCLFILNESCQ